MPPIQPPVFPISMLSSHLLALSFGATYVGSLYLSKNARLRFSKSPATPPTGPEASQYVRQRRIEPGSRDDPAVIRARLTAVTFATLFNCTIVYYLVSRSTLPSSDHSLGSTLALLGLSPAWPTSVLPYLQTPLLFLGPLYASSYLTQSLPGQAHYSFEFQFIKTFCTWIGFRNYIWGPFTEEIVFRACVLSVYAMAGAPRWKMIAFAPLVFGLAHVHHAWEVYNRLGRTQNALKQAAMSALFQTLYTTLFGAHTSYLFLRTSSLLPPLTAHVFCNIMGVPQMGLEIKSFPAKKRAIQIAYAIGIISFIYTLVPWTETPGSVFWLGPERFWRGVAA
ncbi:putative CAAX prenyl protease 2 [Favolaschia claudopus]|uniref:intramembrane prenyl-peptidase Rce1 n=1 Tax=Favolaschia claudopus TaxID=2862362 RepID=A0AAW0CVF2_9AGAR